MGVANNNDSGVHSLSRSSVLSETWGNLKTAIIGCSAAVVFGIVILLMSLLAVVDPVKVFQAGEGNGAKISTASGEIEYYLPYPGMLPDSPVYRLKAIRDRVRLWVTFGEENKAKRELLYADKRVNAAVALAQGGKLSLGVTTATKAEKYLESAANRALGLASRGQDVKSLLLTLDKASAKHAEILEELIGKTGGREKQVLETTLKTTKMVGERVAQALREK